MTDLFTIRHRVKMTYLKIYLLLILSLSVTSANAAEDTEKKASEELITPMTAPAVESANIGPSDDIGKGITATFSESQANDSADAISSNDSSTQESTDNPTKWRRLKRTENWVEEKINPTSKSVENFFTPFIKWTEKKLHKGIPKQEPSPAASLVNPTVSTIVDSDSITENQAINIALSHTQGKLLSAELVSDASPYFHIKIISSQGQINMVKIDASTGNLINSQREGSK